jgi:hypothetical protein
LACLVDFGSDRITAALSGKRQVKIAGCIHRVNDR